MEKDNLLNYLLIFFGTIFIVALALMIVSSFYTFPCVDDFSYSIYTRATWINSKSLINVFYAAWENMVVWYQTWQGTFSAIFLMALQPGLFNEMIYCIGPIAIILLFVLSLYKFTKFLFIDIFKIEKKVSIILFLIICLLCTQFLPSSVQAFYWFNGGFYYTGFFSFFLLFSTSIFKKIYFNENVRSYKVILFCVISFLLGGGNLPNSLLNVEIFTIALIFSKYFRNKNKSLNLMILLVLISAIAGLAISAIAPGNSIRGAIYTRDYGVLKSIVLSVGYCVYFSLTKLNLPIVFLFIISGFIVHKYIILSFKNKIFWFISFVFCFLLISSLFTPPIYAMGSPGFDRNKNIVFFLLVFLVILYEIIFINIFRKNINNIKSFHFIFICILFSVYLFVFPQIATSTSLFRSFLIGEMKEYRETQIERLIDLNNPAIEEVRLQKLNVFPKAIFFDDITDNENDWKNKAMSDYYNKNSVVSS